MRMMIRYGDLLLLRRVLVVDRKRLIIIIRNYIIIIMCFNNYSSLEVPRGFKMWRVLLKHRDPLWGKGFLIDSFRRIDLNTQSLVI